MGILDNILGSRPGAQAGGGGFDTKTLLLMGLLAMIASRSGNAQGQNGEGGGLLGSLGGALGGMLGGGATAGGAAGGLGDLLGGLLGGAQSPAAGAGTPTTSPGDLIGSLGGLGGLTQILSQGGLGEAVNSWVGTGANQPVTADQVTQALGPGGQLQQLAGTAGISESEAAQELSALLPQVGKGSRSTVLMRGEYVGTFASTK
ncbi:YidB family protein [Pandoraea vervacti]|uniref:YidB family protein n=1 Tax=Pandoraea vervacti TaxID=656178 RepID=UPI0005C9C4A8|nr:YidB family protein [Pandoraea vervacti]